MIGCLYKFEKAKIRKEYRRPLIPINGLCLDAIGKYYYFRKNR
jgi:hypothetical protein